MISEESLLVGSPYSSEVCMVNLGRMKRFMRGGEDVEVFHDVKLSVDGKYRYVTRIVEYGWLITDLDPDSVSEGDNDYTSVTVEVYNEEDKIINSVSQFRDPLFLLPVRDGVFLLKRDNELELWDSGLSRCERTFSEGNSVVKIFPVSEELVGRLTDRSKVDILRIANDEIEIAETTTVEDNVTSIICNDRFQFVACSIEKEWSDEKMKIVSIAVWTRQQRLWKRSIITENGINYPSAMIARNDDLVVVWKTFDQGNGVHVLDATTGLTLHKLLTDQIVSECEFLSDGKHFVCLSDDDTIIRRYNVFNTISGELISFIDSDAEYQPRGLTSCFYQPLFAVCLGLSPYQLFRVHLPELKGSERKEKR